MKECAGTNFGAGSPDVNLRWTEPEVNHKQRAMQSFLCFSKTEGANVTRWCVFNISCVQIPSYFHYCSQTSHLSRPRQGRVLNWEVIYYGVGLPFQMEKELTVWWKISSWFMTSHNRFQKQTCLVLIFFFFFLWWRSFRREINDVRGYWPRSFPVAQTWTGKAGRQWEPLKLR